MFTSRKASPLVLAVMFANVGVLATADLTSAAPERVHTPIAVSVDRPASPPGIKIKKVRLEPPEEGDASTTAVLRFDAVNDSADRLTDLVLEISIVSKGSTSDPATSPVISRPFTVEEKRIIEPGYSLQYEIVLKNVSSDCDCRTSVQVRSARSLPASIQ
jgi:hypothetical protein